MGNAELHAEYVHALSQIQNPSFDAIRGVATSLLCSHFDKQARDALYDDLERGVAVIDREELLWQYLYSFGLKHPRHLNLAIGKLPRLSNIVKGGYSIVDWGCGQGLATVCLLDYLRSKRITTLPLQTVFVEPSPLAIENARLHAELYGIDEIKLVQKRLDDVAESDIVTEAPVTLHLFANILDVKSFDLKRLADLVADSAQGTNYFICVCPHYPGDRRLFSFHSYFHDTTTYAAESLVRTADDICASYVVFKFIPGVSSVVQVDYYPPVQFFAAYQLDSLADGRPIEERKDPPLWASFEVAAPFELGGYVYDDVHPVFAVLNNIVTRGLPTRCSPVIEQAFQEYGEILLPEDLGTIEYGGGVSEDRIRRFAQARTPIGVARIQKMILEALICGRLSLESDKWKVLVKERDVPCAALAFEDLKQMLTHLTAMTKDYKNLVMPKVDLAILGTEAYKDSPLHLGADVRTEVDDGLKSQRYDMVIDVSTRASIAPESLAFSEFRAKNSCYFVIGSSQRFRSVRKIYTSDTITYLPLGSIDQHGVFQEDSEVVGHLTYFLNLLFRKQGFRPGQVAILNRALQNENVIGLLPTGAGKSLTYQLAAMLQPGVTIVVDPLRSLMKDQYEGLVQAGIDSCGYINSSISDAEKRLAEKRMESSELQFVFLSPERLCIYEFRERLRTMHEMGVYFSYGVIDEVHCVSEWGHDFRFSYLHLGRNMYNYVHVKDPRKQLTLFGLTATASFDVLSDVERELSGDGAYELDANTIVRYENTDRLELQYKIDPVLVEFSASQYPDLGGALPKARDISGWRANACKSEYLAAHLCQIPHEVEELQSEESIARIRSRFAARQNEPETALGPLAGSGDLSDMLKEHANYDQGAIVFCPHRKSTGVSVDVNRETLTDIVPDIGTFVGSSDDDKERDEDSFSNLTLFKNNRQPLMIATKAFGMGIDKPNVRFTVNMNYPSSLESFVQEAGRAGRDRKISLANILVGDYRLARVSPECPMTAWPLPRIKGHWYYEEDLRGLLWQFRVSVPAHYVDIATPQDDWVRAECIDATTGDSKELRKWKRKMFESKSCGPNCMNFNECMLRSLPDSARGWHRYAEIESVFDRLHIPKSNLTYMNTDYGNNMFFYNSNFVGKAAEERTIYQLLCQTPTEVFYGNDVERGVTHTVPSLIDAVLTQDEDQHEVVAFVPYKEQKSDNRRSYTSAQKAIYRMCCIGFVDDFTQDYARKQFRLVMKRKLSGEYYKSLKQFLARYYADERAEELVAEAVRYPGENEVLKCLGYLTDFIYSKIAVKRKRALDDVRDFCASGLGSDKDWKETNEDLKDHIYYYFNSKYARQDYVADTGEPFSLTTDTDRGRVGPANIVLKYLRVVEDELVGPGGTPIDNVKHLQGAVRLIRRSLTEDNSCLELLNYFCLTQLGTNANEALERELRDSYRKGMTGYATRAKSKKRFWQFMQRFDDAVRTAPHRYELQDLASFQEEVRSQIHLMYLQDFKSKYVNHE